MTNAAEKLRPDLLALPEADREELIQVLAESLESPLTEAEEQAFDAELARRDEEIRSGKVVGISAEELCARLDARLDAVRR